MKRTRDLLTGVAFSVVMGMATLGYAAAPASAQELPDSPAAIEQTLQDSSADTHASDVSDDSAMADTPSKPEAKAVEDKAPAPAVSDGDTVPPAEDANAGQPSEAVSPPSSKEEVIPSEDAPRNDEPSPSDTSQAIASYDGSDNGFDDSEEPADAAESPAAAEEADATFEPADAIEGNGEGDGTDGEYAEATGIETTEDADSGATSAEEELAPSREDGITSTAAYARYDASSSSLTFYRSADAPGHSAVYADFENASFKASTVPWRSIAPKITSVMFADAISPFVMDYWFYGFTNLSALYGLGNVNTGNTISMKALFQNCKKLVSLDLSSWDVSHVVSMDQMFSGCTSLEEVNTSTWNTESLESLNLAFSRTALREIDLRHFDTSKVTVFSQAFSYNPSLTKVDITGWDTSRAYTFAGMFEYCPVLSEVQGLEGFVTKDAKYYQSMFQDAPALTSLDLSSFDTYAAVNMSNMFLNCNSLSTIVLGQGWQPRALGAIAAASTPAGAQLAMNNVNIRALLNGSSWRNTETGEVFTVAQLRDDFGPALAGTWVQVGRLTAVLHNDGTLVFQYGEPASSASVLDSWVDFILNWQSYSDNSSAPWLAYANSIRSVVFSDFFETPFLGEWFRDCKNLVSVSGMQNVFLMPVLGRVPGSTSNDPRDWAYGAMNGMFEGCSSLTSIDLSGFDATNVVNIMHLFTNCTSLRSVNLNGWNVPNLANAACAFEGCRMLERISLDWGDAPNLLRVYRMFRDCKSLQVVEIPSLDAPALIMLDGMFDGCRALQSANLAACLPKPTFLSAKPIPVDVSDVTPGYDDYDFGHAKAAPKSEEAPAFSASEEAPAEVEAASLEEVSAVAAPIAMKAAARLLSAPPVVIPDVVVAEDAVEFATEGLTFAAAASGESEEQAACADDLLIADKLVPLPQAFAPIETPATAPLQASSAPGALSCVLPQEQSGARNSVAFVVSVATSPECATMNRRTLYEARTGDCQCAAVLGGTSYLHFFALPWFSGCALRSPLAKAALKPLPTSWIRPWSKNSPQRSMTTQGQVTRFRPTMKA